MTMSLVAPSLPNSSDGDRVLSTREAVVAAAIEASRLRREQLKNNQRENNNNNNHKEGEDHGETKKPLGQGPSMSTRRREFGFELMKSGLDDSGISIRDLPDLAADESVMGKSSAYSNDSSGMDDSGLSKSGGGDGQRRRRRKPRTSTGNLDASGIDGSSTKQRRPSVEGEEKLHKPPRADRSKSGERSTGERSKRGAPERTKSAMSSSDGSAPGAPRQRNLPERSKSSDGSAMPSRRRLSPTRSGRKNTSGMTDASTKDQQRRSRRMTDASAARSSRRGEAEEDNPVASPTKRFPPTLPRSGDGSPNTEKRRPRRQQHNMVDGSSRMVDGSSRLRRTRTSDGIPSRKEEEEHDDNNNNPISPTPKPTLRRTRTHDNNSSPNMQNNRRGGDRRTSRRPTSHAAQALVNALDNRMLMAPGMAYMNGNLDDDSYSEFEQDMDQSKTDDMNDSTSTFGSTMDESVGGTKKKHRLKKLLPSSLRIFKSSKSSKNSGNEEDVDESEAPNEPEE